MQKPGATLRRARFKPMIVFKILRLSLWFLTVFLELLQQLNAE